MKNHQNHQFHVENVESSPSSFWFLALFIEFCLIGKNEVERALGQPFWSLFIISLTLTPVR